ncbi:MAG: DUF58 domain-containing protein [Bryobacterales bacterium]
MRKARLSRRLERAIVALAGAILLALGAERFYAVGLSTLSFAAATAALCLCCYIVYMSAPHVLGWVRRQRWPFSWSYRITRQGLIYLVTVLAVGTAALSSGNNLIYLVLSSMLAALLLSGLASRLMLSGLQLQMTLPAHIFAGQPVLARVAIRNLKRWLSSFSLWIGTPGSSQQASEMALEEAYCPLIPGGGEVVALIEARFPARGRYRKQQVWLRTRFPFNFAERRARLGLTQGIVVYPSVEPCAEVEQVVRRIEQQWQARDRGDSHDLYRIRPALPGDGARFLDWKAAARAGGLWVREYTRDDFRRAHIVLDRSVPDGEPWLERFEKGIQLCAAVAWRLHNDKVLLQFTSDDFSITSSPTSSTIYEILQYLALTEPSRGGNNRLHWEAYLAGSHSDAGFPVVFTAAKATGEQAVESAEGHVFFHLQQL